MHTNPVSPYQGAAAYSVADSTTAHVCVPFSSVQATPLVRMVEHVVVTIPAHALRVTMETTASTAHVRRKHLFNVWFWFWIWFCMYSGLGLDLVPDLGLDSVWVWFRIWVYSGTYIVRTPWGPLKSVLIIEVS